MTELLKQPRFKPMSVNTQVAVLFAGNKGYLDDLSLDEVIPFRNGLIQYLEGAYSKVLEEIGDRKISPETEAALEQAIADFKAEFVASRDAGSGMSAVMENEGN